MIGLDTNILVAYAVPEHTAHDRVRGRIERFLTAGYPFALTSMVLSEFVHVVTDSKRFTQPLSMREALEWSRYWSDAEETTLCPSDPAVHQQWLQWMEEHRPGRKRLIDTLLAATWHVAGIVEIFTLNPSDFGVFDRFVIHSLEDPQNS
jgi:predicted nucleic acid-binding protein